MNPATRLSAPGLSRRLYRAPRAALFMLAACVAMTACEEEEVTVPPTASVVEVTPRISSVTTGQTVQLAAQPKDAAGNAMSGGTVVWKSLDTLVARVSSAGLVTVLSSGSTAIIATTLGQSGSASIDAIGVVATVGITGSTTGNLPIGQSVQLSAQPREANGRQLFRPVVWASSAPAVATVSSSGLVTSVSVGATSITATVEGKIGTQAINVLPPPPVATVAIVPNTGFLPVTVGVPLNVTLRDANNGVLTGRTVTYTTSDAAIATVSATGVVTAQALGTVTLTATSEGKSGSATFKALTAVKSGAAGILVENSAESDAPYVTYKEFAIYVPTGSTSLVVRLAGGTGDPDLYLFAPGVTVLSDATFACRSWVAGPAETCTMTPATAPIPLSPGVWRVVVDSYNKHTGTQLTATIVPTPP